MTDIIIILIIDSIIKLIIDIIIDKISALLSLIKLLIFKHICTYSKALHFCISNEFLKLAFLYTRVS